MSARRELRRADGAGRVFAALGDETRLAIVGNLALASPQSISGLARNSTLTRQAVTKHLRVLEAAGVVRSVRVGRESLFAFRRESIDTARLYLENVSDEWDQALGRLKALVES